ncbi:transposase [Bradyrhizobium sp. STM 3562]|uniref:transposase n=1 Tax=Bradyrhizobium sp. STM 3562 TaxID=578924 RepID=UPI00388F464C
MAITPISPRRNPPLFISHPLRKAEWVVYPKRPFGGPEAVLTDLSRYTYRVATDRLDERGVTFKWKNHRIDRSR